MTPVLTPESQRMVEYLASRAAALTPAEILARVRSATEDFEASFANVSEDEAHARPRAGKWTIAEVLDHVAQSQVRAAEELRHLVAGSRPPLPPVYEALRSGAPAWAPLAQLIADVRSANRALLDAIPAESDSQAKGAAVIVANSKQADGSPKPQIFVRDVNWREYALLQRLHLLDHRRQIRELRAAIAAGSPGGA